MLALGQYGALPPPSVFSPPGTVPEPTSAALLLLGLLGVGLAARRNKTMA